jgi:hypothetical protein
MIEAAEAKDRIDPNPRKLPIDPMDTAEPTDPTDSTEPIEPMDRTDPFELMDRTELVEWYDHRELSSGFAIPRLCHPVLQLGREWPVVERGPSADRILSGS